MSATDPYRELADLNAEIQRLTESLNHHLHVEEERIAKADARVYAEIKLPSTGTRLAWARFERPAGNSKRPWGLAIVRDNGQQEPVYKARRNERMEALAAIPLLVMEITVRTGAMLEELRTLVGPD